MADAVSLFVSPVVNIIIEKVASLIGEEFLAVQGVKEEAEKLSSNLETIGAVLNDAERRQLDEACDTSLRESLRVWLANLKDAACDAEDILDTFATETHLWKRKLQVRRFPISLGRLRFKSSVAHKIKDISAKFEKLAKDTKRFQNVSRDGVRSHNPRETGFVVDKEDVVGRDSDKDRLIEQMLSNKYDVEGDVCVIPIIGMGGVGKTTLAQLIFNDERVKNHFEFRIWVFVSVEFSLRKILKEMIEFQTKKQHSNIAISVLESRFMEIFAKKNILLVLDDVWINDYIEWKKLQTLLKQGGKGSRVLVTTRDTSVSGIMGTQPPHPLGCLPEDECWSLFKKSAFKDRNLLGGTQKELEEIGRQIVGKCDGLPLAVKAMGGLLRDVIDVSKWKEILRDSIRELENKTNPPKILPALKLSYGHLPPHLKQCYAYCSLFPKGYVFDRTELVKLWMAQSFIQPIGQTSVEETGIGYFDELLMRSFFQVFNDGDDVEYRMHDLIHELAVSVSTPQCCHLKDNESCVFSEKTRHVSLFCQDLENPTLQITEKCKKLRTLLLPPEHLKSLEQETLNKIFDSLKYIRVLDLSSSLLLELPSSIEELKLLGYLDLSRTGIKMLPDSICNLYNLQTLKLLGCLWLLELPKDLGNLVNLHYLELDDKFWFKCGMLPPRMGNLTRLRILHAFPVSGTSGHAIGELKDMVNLTGTLHICNLENAVNAVDAKLNKKEPLQKLVLEWSDKDFNREDEVRAEMVLKDLEPHSNLKELALNHFKGSNFPSWMTNGLLQNLVALTLSHCIKCTILSVDKLPCLRQLYLNGMQELEEWPGVQCPSLGILHISNCPKLRKVPDLMLGLGELKIQKCDSLKALPKVLFLMFLTLIDNLVLEDWQEEKYSFEDDQGNEVVQARGTLNDLLELKMKNCPSIRAFPQEFAPKTLELSGCGLITALPVPEFARRLQHLALDTCSNGTLVKAIPSTDSLYSLVISNISNLTSSPKLPDLPGLRSLSIGDCEDLTSLSEEGSLKSLSSLTRLSIRGCPKLESFPDEGLPTVLEYLMICSCPILRSLGSLKSLSSLKQLSIGGCPKLESFPDEGLPTALEYLMICSCPILRSLGSLKSLLSLKYLKLEDCPLIQSFPDDGLPSSLLHLKIHGCHPLIEKCQKEAAGGTEWPKIKDIPDLEIDSIKLPSASVSVLPKKRKWSLWF